MEGVPLKTNRLGRIGLALSCLSAGLLVACGGGDAGSDTSSSTPEVAAQANAELREQAQAAARTPQPRYTADLREVNDTLVWVQTDQTVGNTSATSSYAHRVTQ